MAEKQDIGVVDELLDSQIAKFPTGADIHSAKRQVPVKLLNTDLEFVTGPQGENTGVIICGLCEVDGIKYAALYDARQRPPKGYVEEVYMSPGNVTTKGFRLIANPTEWAVIHDFFEKNHVWESRRIMNWIMNVRGGNLLNNNQQVSQVSKWLNGVNRTITGKLQPITIRDLIRGSLLQVRNLSRRFKKP